jgi:hypothetical protein
MEDAGWIERRADPGDRRARRLFLTEKGRRVLTRIWDVASETRDEALARLSASEADELIELLQRIHATLSERVPTSATITEPAEPDLEPEPVQVRPPPRREPAREPADAVPVVEVTR